MHIKLHFMEFSRLSLFFSVFFLSKVLVIFNCVVSINSLISLPPCSALLAKLLNKKAEGYFPAEKVLSEEYELVHQAIFTDPDDQSGWFYHLWLLDQTIKSNAPSLVSSWPPHSYRVALSRNRSLDDQTLSPSRSFHSDSETLALILYFDQPVQGVDSSSVSVKSTANLRGDLIWKPLSKCSHDAAKAWVSHLSFPQGEMNSSESYSVVVSLGNSQKITSASGFHHVKPTCFSFEVSVHLGETPIEDCGNEGIWWKDENFTSCSISPQTLPFASSDNLTIENNYAPSSSEWCAEIISNEIALFRELLSETDWYAHCSLQFFCMFYYFILFINHIFLILIFRFFVVKLVSSLLQDF